MAIILKSKLTKVLLSTLVMSQLTACGALSDILLAAVNTSPSSTSTRSGDSSSTSTSSSPTSNGNTEETCEEFYCLILTTGEGTASYSIRSNASITYSYQFKFEGDNVSFSPSSNRLFVLKPGDSRELVTVSAVDRFQSFKWQFNSSFQKGSFNAQHDDNATYVLPYASGEKFRVDQGYFGSFSHNDTMNNFAIDFNMPTGTPIAAARAGTVIDVIDNFTESGPDPSLAEKSNRVLIEHNDGTIANYVHIETNGSRVRVGDKVLTGDIIATSGDVGFASGPHLHFSVMKLTKGLEFESFATSFKTDDGVAQLEEGTTYTAP